MTSEQLQSTGLFKKPFTQQQIDSINTVDNMWQYWENNYPKQEAYVWATIFHETAATMLPIEEYGQGKGRKYGKPDPETGEIYYGRGYSMITHADNYKRIGKLIGVDIYNHPEKALEYDTAAEIIVVGMLKGWFTGRKLSHYIENTKCDYVQARRIINLLDKAELIAGYAKKFEQALKTL